ncbi:MAG: response regulator transcription factor [Saprospiraceae bacterium]|nr:response regulator transcription factor [Saprospiraceae bacterium]
MHPKKILIVEDEARLAELLVAGLQENGMEAEAVHDGYLGKEMVLKNKYDLIILDINLPLINGYDLCKEIRKFDNNIPVIMLTAMATPHNKLAGFDAGADDYITKPFDFDELLARIKVIFKRTSFMEKKETSLIKIADLVINKSSKTVSRQGQIIELTAKEYTLLELLASSPGEVFSRAEISDKIWNLNFDTGTNYVDVYINYLRKKIDKEFDQKLIHTRVGMGYYVKDQNEEN